MLHVFVGVEVFRGLKNLLIQSVDPVAVASTNEPMVGDALKIVIQEIVPEAEETWNTIRVSLCCNVQCRISRSVCYFMNIHNYT